MARRKTLVRIALRDAGTVYQEAYATDCPYLKIHRPYGVPKERIRSAGWLVTHDPTGMGCGYGFNTLAQALNYAKRLGELHDMSFTDTKQNRKQALREAHDRARRFAMTGSETGSDMTGRNAPKAPTVRRARSVASLPDPRPRNECGPTRTVGTLVPAFGRDYRTAKAAKADFLAGRDFLISNFHDPADGKPIHRGQITEGTSCRIRFNRLTKIVTVTA